MESERIRRVAEWWPALFFVLRVLPRRGVVQGPNGAASLRHVATASAGQPQPSPSCKNAENGNKEVSRWSTMIK